MENASKALLIAAAILVVILLIALGMRIFNSTKDVSADATQVGGAIKDQVGSISTDAIGAISGSSNKKFSEMTKEEVNAKFQPYLGDAIPATKIEGLVELINEYNKDLGNHWRILLGEGENVEIWNAIRPDLIDNNNNKPYHQGTKQTYKLRELFDWNSVYKVTAKYVENDPENEGYIRAIIVE